ncbi:MAG: DnaJ domain-containing protein, partial [Acidobacteriota bacterium]|nr:DnaJ domain-containing protein [Acidobacteriota bacterium]
MRDYFQILGVPRSAGAAALRQAHRRLSQNHHPDISGLDDLSPQGVTDDARAAYDGDVPSDEIAIDFPSVGPLVDRMRETFFSGGSASRWSAYIELTRGEARRGARVPIDGPLAQTCAGCAGRGEIWEDGCE